MARTRVKAAAVKIVAVPKIQDVPVPESLDPGKIKPIKNQRGVTAYQKRSLAHFTPFLETTFFQALIRELKSGDKDVLRLYALISKKIESKSGISVTTNVKANSDNDTRVLHNHGFTSIDQLKRMQAARLSGASAPAPIEATPVRDKPEEDDGEE